MTAAKFVTKDQDWQNESTTYWFDFDGCFYGVIESSCGSKSLSASDGNGNVFKLGEISDSKKSEILAACIITDQMRLDF